MRAGNVKADVLNDGDSSNNRSVSHRCAATRFAQLCGRGMRTLDRRLWSTGAVRRSRL